MKKTIPFLVAVLILTALIIAWEMYVAHWEATEHTGGAVIRVDILMIYPLAFLMAVGVFFAMKRILNKENKN